MRLVDADALIELFEEKKQKCDNLQHFVEMTGMQAIIDAQPTAYDVEKVVKQIEKLKNPYDADQWFSDKKLRKAQEIVRKGGAV